MAPTSSAQEAAAVTALTPIVTLEPKCSGAGKETFEGLYIYLVVDGLAHQGDGIKSSEFRFGTSWPPPGNHQVIARWENDVSDEGEEMWPVHARGDGVQRIYLTAAELMELNEEEKLGPGVGVIASASVETRKGSKKDSPTLNAQVPGCPAPEGTIVDHTGGGVLGGTHSSSGKTAIGNVVSTNSAAAPALPGQTISAATSNPESSSSSSFQDPSALPSWFVLAVGGAMGVALIILLVGALVARKGKRQRGSGGRGGGIAWDEYTQATQQEDEDDFISSPGRKGYEGGAEGPDGTKMTSAAYRPSVHTRSSIHQIIAGPSDRRTSESSLRRGLLDDHEDEEDATTLRDEVLV